MSVCFKEILAKVTDVSSYLNLGKVPRLMAVSKFHSVDKIQEAINQGASWFGESYLKELEEKYNQDNLFKKRQLVSEFENNETLSMIKYKESNIIKKILTKIRNMFKRK